MAGYHFIGLGGIGMSALARILLQRGEKVRGSDQVASALLDQLQDEGAQIGSEIQPGDTVVYSTSIRDDHPELQRAKELNLSLIHRADLLHQLIGMHKPLLVAGSHGKTTVTALLTSVLLEAKFDPTFAIGGILLREQTNGSTGKGPYSVAEADESDGSFLKTAAYGAIVTNLGREHLNFWKTAEQLADGFRMFFLRVQNQNHLFWCADDPALSALHPPGSSYGFSSSASYRLSNFVQTERGISFDLNHFSTIELALFGKHNALNGAAVFALARSLGIPEETIRRAFCSFQGTKRRLELVGTNHNIQFYDDYGHHPTEIRATLSALRQKIRERRLVVLFQPHRFSRIADLLSCYETCFSETDLLIVTDVYAAGEQPIPGIDGKSIAEKLGTRYIPRPLLEQTVGELLQFGDAVLTLGAGDITSIGRALLKQDIKKLTVGVLFGGVSPEHDISIVSAKSIISALNRIHQIKPLKIEKDGSWNFELDELRQCAICIPVLHGPQGEDGMIAGMLDTFGIPYVGCDYSSAALCMQKAWTKQIAEAHGIRTTPYIEWKGDASDIRYPVWVKAVHLGSSIGVSRATNEEELQKALSLSLCYDDRAIIEQEIVGREIEFAVMGNEWIRVGAALEILCEGEFYDYKKKYGSQPTKVETPARLTAEQEKRGKELAIRAYEACGCKGLARVDFFLDEQGEFILNEINPMPGFTATSHYPKMWEAMRLSQTDLLDELLILALHRSRKQRSLR